MPDSFLSRVVDSFQRRSEKIAMRIVGDDAQVYTFGETLSQMRAVAYKLEVIGVDFGDRVALIGENHPSWAIAYLGILYRGAVCVPLDPHGETGAIANFLENSDAKIVFIGSEVEDKFDQIRNELKREIKVVVWSAT